MGQEGFCLKLIKGSLALCQEILSHGLVGETCGAVELTEEETVEDPVLVAV